MHSWPRTRLGSCKVGLRSAGFNVQRWSIGRTRVSELFATGNPSDSFRTDYPFHIRVPRRRLWRRVSIRPTGAARRGIRRHFPLLCRGMAAAAAQRVAVDEYRESLSRSEALRKLEITYDGYDSGNRRRAGAIIYRSKKYTYPRISLFRPIPKSFLTFGPFRWTVT